MTARYQVNENSAAEIARAKTQLDQLVGSNNQRPEIQINRFGNGTVQSTEIKDGQASAAPGWLGREWRIEDGFGS